MEELVQDLISYQPTLAGCTATDLSVVDNCKPEDPEAISGCGIFGTQIFRTCKDGLLFLIITAWRMQSGFKQNLR